MTDVVFTLIDVDGASHTLGLDTGMHGIAVLVGAKGLGMPPLTVNANKLPYAPGSALARIATAPYQRDFPLHISGASASAVETLIDSLHGWVMPGTERDSTPRTFRIRIAGTDGVTREIEGVCVGGLDDDDSLEMMGDTWTDTVLSMVCEDPYAYDASATIHTYTSGAGIRSWWPYYPLDLTPSNVYAEETITNDGQLECWPVWTITGPGTSLVLSNLTTGEVLDLSSYVIAAGDVVTIDTSERGATSKTITNLTASNLWPYVSATNDVMWPLERGANIVRVTMAGTTVASRVVMTYRRRWARMHRR